MLHLLALVAWAWAMIPLFTCFHALILSRKDVELIGLRVVPPNLNLRHFIALILYALFMHLFPYDSRLPHLSYALNSLLVAETTPKLEAG